MRLLPSSLLCDAAAAAAASHAPSVTALLGSACSISLQDVVRQLYSTGASTSGRQASWGARSAALAQPAPRKGQQQPHQQADWTQHVNQKFSVRPSLLSPLHPTFQHEQDRHERRQLVASLMAAQVELAKEVEGFDAEQITSSARARIQQIRALAAEFEALVPRRNLARCEARGLQLGYYSVLEEAASQGAGRDEEEFHDVATGKRSAWEHWDSHFAGRYASLPGIAPLEELYRRADPARALREAEGMGEGDGAGGGSGAQRQRRAGLSPEQAVAAGHTPSFAVDAHGNAHADGRRKSSVARVVVRPGSGALTVNGQPLDTYFRDLLMRSHVLNPLLVADRLARYDMSAVVEGGGPSGQARSVGTGLARALLLLEPALGRGRGQQAAQLRYLARRDSRSVERMKPGRAKSRKGYAWVKR